MNQIIKKRRLSPLETSVFGNVIYVLLVLIFKNIFDASGSSNFNYLVSGLQLGVVGVFWIGLFAVSFKNIYAGDKKRYFSYVFYTLIPILILTASVTLVTIFAPGETASAIWNQFTFLAAPTIFWYLPYGIIYQLTDATITVFVLFGIGLLMTIIFQISGIILGRILGKKYWLETKKESKEAQVIQEKKEKVRKRKKSKKQREFIGMEKISDEITSESFRPEKPEHMTQVIIEDSNQSKRNVSTKDQREKLFQKITSEKSQVERNKDSQQDPPSKTDLRPPKPASIPILEDADRIGEDIRINEETIREKDPRKEALEADKSFLMETSQIKIIDEEDIKNFYKDKEKDKK